MKIFKFGAVAAIVSLGLFLSAPVWAQTGTANNTSATNVIQLKNPLSANTPQELIGEVINTALGLVGSIALLMFVYGGLTWMTSAGNAEKVKKGRDIILWSAVGLVLIFASYALTRVLLESLSK